MGSGGVLWGAVLCHLGLRAERVGNKSDSVLSLLWGPVPAPAHVLSLNALVPSPG